MVRVRHSANPRPRVAFRTGAAMPVRRIDGVTIPDPAMVTLLEQARDQGFRMEAGTGGGHAAATGFTLYPPDKAHAPIRVGCTEVNPSHVANVRRTLLRAGFVPPTTEEPPMPAPRKARKAKQPSPSHHHLAPGSSIRDALESVPEEDRSTFVATLAASGVQAAGLAEEFQDLAGLLVATVFDYAKHLPNLPGAGAGEEALAEWERVAATYAKERDEARAQVERLEQQVNRLEGKYDGCVADLRTAREERDGAQAEADRLAKALAPLRALLAET